MVESIAPVVYGGKARYRWAVVLHAGAAALAGGIFGLLLATIGLVARAPWGTTGAIVVSAIAIAYAARELFGLPLPLFDRKQQVPDWWRTFYGPHVAASLYGAGLGIGFLTFLRYGTYLAVCAIAIASGEPLIGALLGATFGLSRGLTALTSAKTNDEVEAADVVHKLEGIAVGDRPRIANAIVLVAIAVVAITTSCVPEAGPASGPGSPRSARDRSSLVYGAPRVIGTIQDRRIGESSGLAASKKQPGILWTHNDSGDAPVVYAMTRKGRSLGMWTVDGAEAFDWEDMALGPGEETGLAYLYVGDIGDNTGTRTRVAVYRFPEPRVEDVSRTVTAEKLELTYPDGPHNAEALMVDPFDGTIYILTKSSGSAVVYRTDWVDSGAATLEQVTRLKVPGSFGGVTGADISPAGDRVVISTYTGAVELVLAPGKDFDSIWHSQPRQIDVGERAQGEAIAYSAVGSSILATSEGIGSPIILVRLKP